MEADARATVRALLGTAPRQRDHLLEHLHRIHDAHGCLPASLLVALAEEMRLAPIEVFEVAGFYHLFDIERAPQCPPRRPLLRVCDSLSCAMRGAQRLRAELEDAFGDRLDIRATPCIGQCAAAPAAVLGERVVAPADVPSVRATLEHGDLAAAIPAQAIDLAAYRAAGGYRLLADCHGGRQTREALIDELEQAGLRGLGGAGFPTARKWRILRDRPPPRLMVVNADEGEPGTFKDRECLERDPHGFLEGMLLAAWTIEAERIYLYLRGEYGAARRLLERELAALRADPSVPLPIIELRRGAGAYVCGEESALLESIEGRRGLPRQRPPYVAEVGLFGRPTLVQNVETLYRARQILYQREHAAWRGWSVSGRVRRPGVYPAPPGISARELIERAGGMAEGHELYGFFPGGASGGILPAALADLSLDFGSLEEYGCFVGSAALIPFSRHDSVRDLALNAMRFFANESCGQCTPCRVGTERAAALMAANEWDTERLRDLATVMRDASICGLGQAAPNPLLSVLRHFPEALER